MANWKVTIDVSDIWQKFEDEEDFDTFKKELVSILKSKIEEVTEKLGEDEAMQFEDLVGEIEHSVDDVEEFDYVWSNIYDWADVNKIWIATF